MRAVDPTPVELSLVFLIAVASVAGGQSMSKKLIQFGWDIRSPGGLAEQIRAMEKAPFDGIFIRPRSGFTFHVLSILCRGLELYYEAPLPSGSD